MSDKNVAGLPPLVIPIALDRRVTAVGQSQVRPLGDVAAVCLSLGKRCPMDGIGEEEFSVVVGSKQTVGETESGGVRELATFKANFGGIEGDRRNCSSSL